MRLAKHNLYALLEDGFPRDLDSRASKRTTGLPTAGATCSTRVRASLTGCVAEACAGARVAVQVDKSPECLMLYLATLRAGYVYLPLNTAYQRAEIEYFLRDAEPAVTVCSPARIAEMEPLAHALRAARIWSRSVDARDGTLLEAAAPFSDEFDTVPLRRRPGGDSLHVGHDRPQQGRDAVARQPRIECADARPILGFQGRARGRAPRHAAARVAAVSRARAVRRIARRAAGRRAGRSCCRGSN
jgi:acyl-CoA synthetase (AMP-forming)/AMP-acid ligase II